MSRGLSPTASATIVRSACRTTASSVPGSSSTCACSSPPSKSRLPRLAQSSAYRNLAVLERAGVVHRIVAAGEFARYELAEDLTEHHHHLICATCGDVRDFTVSPELEGDLDRALGRIARQHGFSADHHRLDLVGTCSACG